ncbi:hypothetical protein Bca52824_002361 [Brassica carinata]|uniref:Uncharacterized protein n=1 Tax=Brassica carinata TaxID=52824 RepID=A0A8X7WK59_BRACI|nr:hypothetical protein Bca52824_002361 [Brassica carinata]
MIEDTAHSADDFLWDDEVGDETVDALVRLIREGYAFKKTMFVGGLTTADLSRMREEKKQKEKEPKDKKERESQPDSPEIDASEPCDHNHIAKQVAVLVTPTITDAIAKEGDKLEVKLAAVIQAEVQKMQGAVLQSLIASLGKQRENSLRPEENTNTAYESGDNTQTASEPPSPSPPNENPPENMTPDGVRDAEMLSPTHLSTNKGGDAEVENVIKNVVNDVQALLNADEKSYVPNEPPNPPMGQTGEDADPDLGEISTGAVNVSQMQAQKSPTPPQSMPTLDEEGSLGESKIDFLLSLIETPTFSLGLSQEEPGRMPIIPHQPVDDGICETRKSKRTRTLPPILSDYQCDPKVKAFRVENTVAPYDPKVEEVYLSMRESAGHNNVEEMDSIVDLSQQMPPKVMDVLIYYISVDRFLEETPTSKPKIAFYDSNFPASP